MESKKQSGDTVKAERSGAREEEEMEIFLALIKRFGEIRRKKEELLMVHRPNAGAGDDDHDQKKKRIKWTASDEDKRKKEVGSITISSSNWVPRFRLEDFGINYKTQKQELTQVGDEDDVVKHHEQDDDLNLKLAL